MNSGAWTHAGGVVYRNENGPRELLLVRAKPAPHEWVLPKGHIEHGETAAAAARREIREEAGVDSEPLQQIGEDRYTTDAGENVSVVFFLMKFVGDVKPDERREKRWCSLDEAISLTPFDGLKAILKDAGSLLARERH
jgi:ADP-ribose pyrophosphatase YjhB (NUDIX family)